MNSHKEANDNEIEAARSGLNDQSLMPIERVGQSPAKNSNHTEPLRVVDAIPQTVWVALLASAAERLTYYSITAPWQNYMQNSPEGSAVPGALGLGQATATNIYNAFYLFSFLTPLLFAVVSDVWLGRYNTLCISFACNLCGCIILFVTSLRGTVDHDGQLGGLLTAMVCIGLGTGGVTATVSPFIGDQYSLIQGRSFISKSGERLIGDRNLTLQYIYNVSYWFTNIACLSLIGSTCLEKEKGFWAAYLLSLCSFWIAVLLMLLWRTKFVKLAPQGNILPRAAKVLAYAARDKFRLDAAQPINQLEKYGRSVPWDSQFVVEIRRGLVACKVMACFSLFYLCIGQMSNNLVSQASQMKLQGIPNDAVLAIHPISCIILGPLIQNVLYPLLYKHKISFGPIARMTAGFILVAVAMAYAAGLQRIIYSTGPCYEEPLTCPSSENGTIPNDISIWAQIPVHFLLALGEIFGFATLSEYSYSKAPKDMKSLVQAMRQLSAGIGSAFGIALSTVSSDLKILWLYTALAVAMVISAPVFWIVFSKFDTIDEELNNSGD